MINQGLKRATVVGLLEILFGLPGLVLLVWMLANYDSGETMSFLIIFVVPLLLVWMLIIPFGVVAVVQRQINWRIHLPVFSLASMSAFVFVWFAF